jgi:outer membrane protein
MLSQHVVRWLLAAVPLAAAAGPAWAVPETAPTTMATEPTTTAAATQPAGGTLAITVSQAILTALEHNRAFIVQRYTPDLRHESVEIQRAVFDPVITATLSGSRTRSDTGTSDTVSMSSSAEIGFNQLFTTGLEMNVTLSSDADFPPGNDTYTQRIALGLTQPLLQGFGTAVNLASLRQAEVDYVTSQYELRGLAETLVADVEKAYWDYALGKQKTQIVVQSLKIAQDQLTDTQERVRVGSLAQAQLAGAEAEVALRQEELIDARSTENKARLALLRLLSPPGDSTFAPVLVMLDKPTAVGEELGPVDMYIHTALDQRPDLNQARLAITHGDLEIVKTRNGLLPVLDLFINLGRTAYAEAFGSSVDQFGKNSSYDAEVGLSFQYPPLNRSARATHRRALLTRDQSAAALNNLIELAEDDVRTAYIEVLRTKEQVSATTATRKAREETLRVEVARLQADKSTTLLVSIAQRDLLSSQVAEVEAVVNYLDALLDLYRLNGSLLERRGIAAPGGAPVRLVLPAYK